MASSLIANSLQVDFESVLMFPEEGMAAMFKALESSGLRGFLGCSSGIYEADLAAFFQNALVRENSVVNTIQGKSVQITEEQFYGIFELPTEGLSDLSEVLKDLIFDARSIFSKSGEQVQTSCKKRKMKYEFFLLNDILAKSVTVKAWSFDSVTHERFLFMTAIHYGLKINWNFIESFAQLRASVTQLFIKQLRTKESIGNLKNQLLSKIDNLEKALAEAHTQQDQVLRGLIKIVRQEVQIHKTALYLEFLSLRERRLAPTSFTGKLALQRLAAVDLLIRSTTGNRTPSLACTRRPDEFITEGISSSRWPERVRRKEAATGGAWGDGREECLYDPQWFRDIASRGLTIIATPKSQFRTDPSDHGKAPSNIAP
ncbi:hypothetical protein F511_26700 [Dorcoceras hygrometricum]|uniref:Uncharacterized protein n=1 Tax=Dorcoceras hygrometricum TaxID=472368 RepID=A0A2Z7BF81_9LAMI|nr:hypothetical protein F511_26700 [Dorcoceras hygrometricum]